MQQTDSRRTDSVKQTAGGREEGSYLAAGLAGGVGVERELRSKRDRGGEGGLLPRDGRR
jgi:hypothetical protein